jgi:ribosomal protein S18 acetylase RimI-like enzyme
VTRRAVNLPTPAGARVVTSPDELAEFFADRPDVHAYALGDLDEPFWSLSHWFRRGDAVVGLVGMPGGEGTACYSVSTRDPGGSIGLLLELVPHLRPAQLITGPVGLADALSSVRRLAWHGPHLRYSLTDRAHLPARSPDAERIHSVRDLSRLYATEPGAAFFLPHMVDDGAFRGVRVDGDLVAAAGTHVLSEARGIAAIGAVYTAPGFRGRGFGRAVTVAVCRDLAERVPVVGLNVTVENAPARAIYDSIGFTPVHSYEEAELS